MEMEIRMISQGISVTELAEKELERLVNIYGSGLIKYCHSILLDYHEAQDIVQGVFIKAYLKLERDCGAVIQSAWLYKSSYNMCIDVYRRRKLQQIFALRQSEESYTESYFIDHEVNDILKQLSPKERALVYNRAVEGLDYDQLERIYGIKSATLRKRYERARKKLIQTLNENEIGGCQNEA